MRILCNILVVLFVTATAVGQQINPVPDYIFRNSMSVGRNAPTDTSAYFSIGPRFGATRGFMPPMVTDTASVTGTKRNGLLIYSIQRNSFLYWDSTGSRWSRIAANLDTSLLSTRAWRQKGDDSLAAIINTRTDTVNLLSTKAWRQKGIDSVAGLSRVTGSGTSGQISYWNGTTSQAGEDSLQWSAANNRLTILGTGGNINSLFPYTPLKLRNTDTTDGRGVAIEFYGSTQNGSEYITGSINVRNTSLSTPGEYASGNMLFQTTNTSGNMFEGFRLTASQETIFGTSSDAGDYRVQVSGNLYNTGGALLGATSGNLLVRNATPSGSGGITIGVGDNVGGVVSVQDTDGSRLEMQAFGALTYLFTVTNHPLLFGINNVEAARFTTSRELLINTVTDNGDFVLQLQGNQYTSGNLGLGITSPSTRLHLQGTITFNTGANTSLQIIPAATIAGTDPNRIATVNTTPLSFETGAVERMRILATGNVGVGTNAPAYLLDVAGSFRNTTDAFFNTTSGESYYGTTSDTGNFRVQISGNAFISQNVGIGQATFGTSANKVMAFNNGTAPSTSPADAFQLYSADITAGNAAAHFRTENGAVIKLYQETTGVAGATRAAVAGNTISDADTFDGYTVPQVVKALRNLGILQ
jgi:hypothetical protein